MTIIITMAGLGTRFKKAGYHCPKYMIEARGKTLFEWSMDSLKGFHAYTSKYVFVVRAQDNAADFIHEKCRAYGISNMEIVELDYMTEGQAATCMLAIPYCTMAAPILIYNIDTYVEPYEMEYESITGDGYIPCFHAQGTHWSFVKLDGNGKVIEVKEKERISDNCTLGAYYFSSAKLYKELYEEFYGKESDTESAYVGERQDHKETGPQKSGIAEQQRHNETKKQAFYEAGTKSHSEKYIAPLYQFMVEKGLQVAISIVDADKVHVLGTPEELEVFVSQASAVQNGDFNEKK